MSSKKKKPSNNFAKQNEAHYKKQFFQKVIEIAKAVSENDSYKLLNSHILEKIYLRRIKSVRVLADDDLNISSDELRAMKEEIVTQLKRIELKIEGSGFTILLYDLAGPGFSLWITLHQMKSKYPDQYPSLLKAFDEFIDSKELILEIYQNIYLVSNYIGWDLTAFDKKYISGKLEYKLTDNGTFGFYPTITMKGYPVQMISVTIDGNTRPAFRIGIAAKGNEPEWFDMEAEKLGLKHLPPETKVPVYIQHHAINRLKERIDCSDNAMIFINIIHSLGKGQYIYYHGNRLIAFEYNDHKIGYLMIDMVNDVAVIRTFLLLTHSNTPEGDSLKNLLGLEKHDITYLNLDKLSTFVNSDFREKTLLCDLFTRAGCKPLIEVPKEDFNKDNFVARAATIESYLSKYQEYNTRLRLEDLFVVD